MQWYYPWLKTYKNVFLSNKWGDAEPKYLYRFKEKKNIFKSIKLSDSISLQEIKKLHVSGRREILPGIFLPDFWFCFALILCYWQLPDAKYRHKIPLIWLRVMTALWLQQSDSRQEKFSKTYKNLSATVYHLYKIKSLLFKSFSYLEDQFYFFRSSGRTFSHIFSKEQHNV